MDERSLRWNWQGPRVKSHFTKAVSNIFKEGSRSAKLIADGLKIVVGSGDRAEFCSDMSWDSASLSVMFPRIFTLAIHKTGAIKEFGHWSESSWVWEVKLRRPVFYWEQAQSKMFKEFLCCIQICRNISDSVARSFRPNGEFSIGSFGRGLESDYEEDVIDCNRFWKGFCPPKIDLFIWQLYRDRIMVQ
ncbi:hypothetical protein Dsin_022015 [Dipteronia sinensis]|uniref:Reverse transcriptase zinc-binding domain-containing protein n=1 Tax=Dipteronia sinensis TaxID=43782 RepID=A0AAE0A0Q6_9ROSI|nr:hypothetical protein Dsin_022015 [Dipteronia sinensis]